MVAIFSMRKNSAWPRSVSFFDKDPASIRKYPQSNKKEGIESMKAFGIALSVSILFCVMSAFAQSVKSDFDAGYDFSKWKSYDFAPAGAQAQQTFLQNSLNEKRIKTEAESQLKVHGFLKTENGKPDFLISARIAGRPVTRVESQSLPPAGRRGGVGPTVSVPRQSFEATVMLDFLDPGNNQLIWRGLATDAIDPAKPEKLINKGIEKIVKQFVKDAGKGKAE
jgi:hypothetical protein